jgi:outer membrane protein assembly factor BamB
VSLAIQSTPVMATPPGGVKTVYYASDPTPTANGHVWAFSVADCSQEWAFNQFNTGPVDGGVWDPLGYAVDATGRGLVLFGSADPDSSIYALDANSGAEVWRYQTYAPDGEDWDVGAGVTTSAPGVNGFADGVAYTVGKDGIVLALDLTTGALIWSNNLAGNAPGHPPVNTDTISTPALSGTTLIVGGNSNPPTATEWAINAVTGATIWEPTYRNDSINSSALIVGPPGSQVVAFTDLNGTLRVVDLADGSTLYSYTTAGLVTSSPAEYDGNIVLASGDGFLYDFAVGGGSGSTPTTTVTSPANAGTIANPDGPVTISGTASAPDGVAAVDVEVQTPAGTGNWVNAESGTAASGFYVNQAVLASPGATTTKWNLAVPAPLQGASFKVLAEAVGANQITDTTAWSTNPGAATDTFTVAADPNAPQAVLKSPRMAPMQAGTMSVSGFARSESVTARLAESPTKSVKLFTAKVSTTGSLSSANFTVPAPIPFGPLTITVTGATSGRIAATQLYVSNNSLQAAYGPTHTGFEPNDPAISSHQATTRQNMLTLDWSLSAGGAIDTTPAVTSGVAYIGDLAGDVYAVDAVSGSPIWTVQAGSAVESSPAVDGTTVFVGDDAGQLLALDSASGATVWTAQVSSAKVSSPTVAVGVVYVTSAGTLTALNESTGAEIWSQAVDPVAVTAPTVDTAVGVIAVGTNSGAVIGYSLAGAPIWTVPTGGPVTGSPAIASGAVYAGSTSGRVYNLNETTGAAVWSVSVGSPVDGAVDVGPSAVEVGTRAGQMVSLTPAKGASIGAVPIGGPITGVASTAGITVASVSTGRLVMSRSPSGDVETWIYKDPNGSYPAAGVIINGGLLVADSTGQLLAFGITGQPLR